MNGLNNYYNSLKIALFNLVEKIKFSTYCYKLAFVSMWTISPSAIRIQSILKCDYQDDDCCCGGNCCCGECVWTPEDPFNPLGLKDINLMENSNIMMELYNNPIWIITILGLIGLLLTLLLLKLGISESIVKNRKSTKSSSKQQGWWFFWWWKSKPQESSSAPVSGVGPSRTSAAAPAPVSQRESNERWSFWWWKSNSKPKESYPLAEPKNEEERIERLGLVNDKVIKHLNEIMDKRPRRWINDEDIPDIQKYTNNLLTEHGINNERRYEHIIPSLVKGFRVLNAPDLQAKYNEIDSSLGSLKTKRHIIPNINYKPETGEMRLEIEFAPPITTSIGSDPRVAINRLRAQNTNTDNGNTMASSSRATAQPTNTQPSNTMESTSTTTAQSTNIQTSSGGRYNTATAWPSLQNHGTSNANTSEVSNSSRPVVSSSSAAEASNTNTPETSDNKSIVSSDTNVNNFTRVSEEAICYKDFVENYMNKSMTLETYNTPILNNTIIIMGVIIALIFLLKLLNSNEGRIEELKKGKLSGFFVIGSTTGNAKSNVSNYEFDMFQDYNSINYFGAGMPDNSVIIIEQLIIVLVIIVLALSISLSIILEISNLKYDKKGNRVWWGINFVSIYKGIIKNIESIIKRIKSQLGISTTTTPVGSAFRHKQKKKSKKNNKKNKIGSNSSKYIAGCGLSKVADPTPPVQRGTFAPRKPFTDNKDRLLGYDDQIRLEQVNIKGIELSSKIGRRADINTEMRPPRMDYNKDLECWELSIRYSNFNRTKNVFYMRDEKDVKIIDKFLEKLPLKTGANYYKLEGNSAYCVSRRNDSNVWGRSDSNVGGKSEIQSSVNKSVKYNEETINSFRLNDNINNIIDSSTMLSQTFYNPILNYIIIVFGAIFGLVLILKLLKSNDNKFGFAFLTIVPGRGIDGIGDMPDVIVDPVKIALEIGEGLLFILNHAWFKFFMDYCGIVGLVVLWHVCTSMDVKIFFWRIQAELYIFFKNKKKIFKKKYRKIGKKIGRKIGTMSSTVTEVFTGHNGNVLTQPEQSNIRFRLNLNWVNGWTWSIRALSQAYLNKLVTVNNQDETTDGLNNRENSWIKSHKRSDVPLAWGLYFQDGASPSVEGIVDLHNRIMFYLVVILFGVTSVMISIMWNFNKGNNKLVYRYLNHGTLIELIWTVGPALVLVAIAFPSFKLLYLMDKLLCPYLII
jgi:Cytochrome C oxidase subunit II, transmembrane domain